MSETTTQLIFPELILKLSAGVQELKGKVIAEPKSRAAWQSLYEKATNELLMRMMSRIPRHLPVDFQNTTIEPDERELIEYLSTCGHQDI